MKVTITTTGTETLAVLEGRVDTTNASDFEQQIAGLYTLPEACVVFDCTDFVYISSSGLRSFLTLLKHLNAHKGRLILRNLRPEIKEVFDMTGFSSIFCIE